MRSTKDVKALFFRIFLGKLEIPLSSTIPQCRRYSLVSKRIDTVVHVRNWVRIPGCFCIQGSVVGANVKGSVLLRYEDNSSSPFRLCRLDDVDSKHSIHFLYFEFSHPKLCTVRGWVNWLDIPLRFDSLRHCLNRTKVSVSHTFEECKPIN